MLSVVRQLPRTGAASPDDSTLRANRCTGPALEDKPIVTGFSSYVFTPLRRGELILDRGSGDGLDPILLVTLDGEYSARESFKRLEYALRAALDPDRAARPLTLEAEMDS